jgi:hypothetical protein
MWEPCFQLDSNTPKSPRSMAIKKGTNLTQEEVNVLTCIDFILVGGHVKTSTHNIPQT